MVQNISEALIGGFSRKEIALTMKNSKKKYKERTKQSIKLLKWIKAYPGLWQLICEPNNEHMNLEMMQSLIKQLHKESFYEIIFVLLTVHKNESFMKSLNESLLNDLIIEKWQNGNEKDILDKLLLYLE